jgi:hypothetical protein
MQIFPIYFPTFLTSSFLRIMKSKYWERKMCVYTHTCMCWKVNWVILCPHFQIIYLLLGEESAMWGSFPLVLSYQEEVWCDVQNASLSSTLENLPFKGIKQLQVMAMVHFHTSWIPGCHTWDSQKYRYSWSLEIIAGRHFVQWEIN